MGLFADARNRLLPSLFGVIAPVIVVRLFADSSSLGGNELKFACVLPCRGSIKLSPSLSGGAVVVETVGIGSTRVIDFGVSEKSFTVMLSTVYVVS